MIVKHNLSTSMSDEDNEVLDATNSNDEQTVDESSDDNDDVEVLKAELAEAREAKRLLTLRAKKAEGLLKAKGAQPEQQASQASHASATNVEETVLLANGMDEELLTKLKKVAEVQGVSLIKAQNDPIFVAVKENFEKEKKAAAASMPASRGSGTMKPKKDFTTPGLTREEHQALFSSTL